MKRFRNTSAAILAALLMAACETESTSVSPAMPVADNRPVEQRAPAFIRYFSSDGQMQMIFDLSNDSGRVFFTQSGLHLAGVYQKTWKEAPSGQSFRGAIAPVYSSDTGTYSIAVYEAGQLVAFSDTGYVEYRFK